MKYLIAFCATALLSLALQAQPFADVTLAQPLEASGGGLTVTTITGELDTTAGAGGTTVATTDTAAVGTIVVVVVVSGAIDSISGVSDASGNTYQLDADITSGLGQTLFIFSSRISTELASGANITVTRAGYGSHHARGFKISSAQSSGAYLDVASETANGYSNPHTVGPTASVAEANEIAIVGFNAPSAGISSWTLSNFTQLINEHATTLELRYVVGWLEVDSGTVSETLTMSGPGSGSAAIAVYKTE